MALANSDDSLWESRHVHNKIEYWFWTSLFSGWFREKQNSRAIEDLKRLFTWVTTNVDEDGKLTDRERSIFQETNYSNLDTLMLKNSDQSVPKAIYNGILQYVLSTQPNDFSENLSYLRAWEVNTGELEDHHIIPLGSNASLETSAKDLRSNKNHLLNSPLNRTLISKVANRKIRSRSLPEYLKLLNEMAEYTHAIPVIKDLKDDTKFYEDFLSDRFTILKRDIIKELQTLKA